MQEKLFSKDFTMVVIGQVISLFGNAAIRFVLPLYLLNQTGSAMLYGIVTACAFIPSVLLSPVGGIVADRVNKKNIMVVLDFFTAAVIVVFALLKDGVSLIGLLTATLMLLYGIAGAYQPSVQASIPALVSREHFVAANSVIQTISSFSSLLGPVIGGMLYSTYGLELVLWICTICFLASAVMEIFIKIPFEKQARGSSIWGTVKSDFVQSFRFIRKEKPVVGKGVLVAFGLNLFMSSMLMVGMPYIITEVLDLGSLKANQLCGFAEGALAAGGLCGAACAGIFARRLAMKKAGNLIVACAICVFPMGFALMLCPSGLVNYVVMTLCCFMLMICSTVFTIQIMSFVQAETPQNLTGKVIAVIFAISMCAQPLGSALYGVLFELCRGMEFVVVLFAGLVSFVIAVCTKKIFADIISTDIISTDSISIDSISTDSTSTDSKSAVSTSTDSTRI